MNIFDEDVKEIGDLVSYIGEDRVGVVVAVKCYGRSVWNRRVMVLFPDGKDRWKAMTRVKIRAKC